jgi:hypothetical protein
MRQDVHAAPNSELTHIQEHTGMKIRRDRSRPLVAQSSSLDNYKTQGGQPTHRRVERSWYGFPKGFGEAEHAEWN